MAKVPYITLQNPFGLPILVRQVEIEEEYKEFLDREMPRLFEKSIRSGSLEHVLTEEALIPGFLAEFGVFSGKSINQIAERYPERTVYGFDSFEGFPSDWEEFSKDKSREFFTREPPEVRDNVTLIKGWFRDVLPRFLEEESGPCALAHIDCDLYESTVDVLTGLRDRIVPGTILVFDDMTNNAEYGLLHEMKAFWEFIRDTSKPFEWLNHGYDLGIVWWGRGDYDGHLEQMRSIFGFPKFKKEAVAVRFL
jgi:hypothetical protein